MFLNAKDFSDSIEHIISIFHQTIGDNIQTFLQICQLIVIIWNIIIPIIFMGQFTLMKLKIESDKLILFTSLISIPKNNLSDLEKHFKIKSNRITSSENLPEEETNKQEDHLLKIFSTSESSKHSLYAETF
jgi:hypothetical protein